MRESLYGEFIGECARLLVHAFTIRSSNPETLLTAYSLFNRTRLRASHEALAAAERLLGRITDHGGNAYTAASARGTKGNCIGATP